MFMPREATHYNPNNSTVKWYKKVGFNWFYFCTVEEVWRKSGNQLSFFEELCLIQRPLMPISEPKSKVFTEKFWIAADASGKLLIDTASKSLSNCHDKLWPKVHSDEEFDEYNIALYSIEPVKKNV